MTKTLKQSLTQAIRMMHYDLGYLESRIQHATTLQAHSLTNLSLSMAELLQTVNALPRSPDPLSSNVRHSIRNQLTVIGGYAQLLLDTRHSSLEATTRAALENILATTKDIVNALAVDKTRVAESS